MVASKNAVKSLQNEATAAVFTSAIRQLYLQNCKTKSNQVSREEEKELKTSDSVFSQKIICRLNWIKPVHIGRRR